MIDLNDITIRICGKTLLENASAHIPDNKKVGLIGHNGCGKSTLFRAILNEQSIETGTISYPTNSRIAHMRQEMNDTDVSPLNYLLSADKERTELLNRLQNAPETQLAEIYERLSAIEADTAEARACQILKGLGFKDTDFHRPLSEFSGGWRMRVALAATLFQPSDILLLDEPTQGLDVSGENQMYQLIFDYQKQSGCCIVMASHDLNFVLARSNQVLCLNGHLCCQGKPDKVKNYSLFDKVPYTHHHDHVHTLEGTVCSCSK